jgi:hypothetical protein
LRQGGEPFNNRFIPRIPVRSTRHAQLFNEALARDSGALCLGRPPLKRPIEVTSIFDFRELSAIAAATSHPFTGVLRSICGPTSELGTPPLQRLPHTFGRCRQFDVRNTRTINRIDDRVYDCWRRPHRSRLPNGLCAD